MTLLLIMLAAPIIIVGALYALEWVWVAYETINAWRFARDVKRQAEERASGKTDPDDIVWP